MNKFLTTVAAMAILTTSCTQKATNEFNYNVDKFADIEVLRYKVPGFEELSLDQKKIIYYLNETAKTAEKTTKTAAKKTDAAEKPAKAPAKKTAAKKTEE